MPLAKTLDEPEPAPAEEAATRRGLPSKRGSESTDLDKRGWEAEFVANEATLLNFSDSDEEE